MRVWGLKILLVTIVLLFSGCMEYEDHMVLEWDQSGVLQFAMGLNEAFMDEDSEMSEEELWAQLSQIEAVSPEWVSVYHDGGHQWAEGRVVIPVVNALVPGASEDFPMFGHMEWYEENGTWQFQRTLILSDDAPDELVEPGADEFLQLFTAGIVWKYSVQFPGEIISANTAERNIDYDANVVTWSFSLGSLMSQPRVMTAEIRSVSADDPLVEAVEPPAPPMPVVHEPVPADDGVWWAVSPTSLDEVAEQLAAGAPVDARDDTRRTALMHFASLLEGPELVKLMLEHGADVHARGHDGSTALMYAVSYGAPSETIEALLAAGSPLGARTERGESALSLAIRNDAERAVVRLLLEHGADPNSRQIDGLTPLLQAAHVSADPQIIALLLDHGGDPLLTHNDATALVLAAAFNPHAAVVETLLDVDSDWEKHETDGQPLLMRAILNPNPAVAELIISYGADVHFRHPDGTTVLMHAAEHAVNPDVIDVLLWHDVDGSLQNDRGMTAFDLAKKNPRIDGTDAYWRLNDARF